MNYFPKYAALPADLPLLEQIEAAAEGLSTRLCLLELSTLGISEYNQRYLSVILKNLRGVLTLNAYLLALAFTDAPKPLSKMVFVDYGGGCGILTFLAIELGVGTVIYNDIYDVSCRDACTIGCALERHAAAYVCGDIDELMQYVVNHSQHVDTMISYDVIEHIYDLGVYFNKLPLLSDGSMRVVFASSANSHNPLINRQRISAQKVIELKDRPKEWGHKERDALQSYLGIRKKIIFAYAPHLTPGEVDKLARATRGLIKQDIEKVVVEYNTTGIVAHLPDHSSNTCDPLTGNWAEHLMDTVEVKSMLSKSGFNVSVLPGYFDSAGKSYKQVAKELLNLAIRRLGGYNLAVAPYYVICGTHNPVKEYQENEYATQKSMDEVPHE